jgi:hypothetical protein
MNHFFLQPENVDPLCGAENLFKKVPGGRRAKLINYIFWLEFLRLARERRVMACSFQRCQLKFSHFPFSRMPKFKILIYAVIFSSDGCDFRVGKQLV